MNKKLVALSIVTLMLIGLLPTILPLTPVVQAGTAGPCDQGTPDQTYHGSPMCVFLHPGVDDAYKDGPWSHTLDTLWNTQATVGDEQREQVFDKYLDYAVLASASDSIGDFQLDLQLVRNVSWVDIFVPPEFTWLGPSREESVWTDITNDYEYIWTSTRHPYDTIAPGWVRVRIGMDEWYGNLMNITAGIYHVRFFNLRAPEVAGMYHLKIYYGIWDYTYTSIGAGNFPLVAVKTELNPAIIEVVVRTHAWTAVPFVSGRVMAEGTTPEGRTVEGIAWWGPTEFIGNSVVPGEAGALYRTWLFGLAAGTYTITAEASGFNPSSSPGGERVVVNPGQSLHIFIVIFDSPDVCVTVWSKHGTGAIPWHNLWQLPMGTNNPAAVPIDFDILGVPFAWRDIGFELFDSDGNMIGWWYSDFYVVKSFAPTNQLLGLHDDGNGVTPSHTSYYACLVDNWDLLGNLRMYPSTHWDGHVPWDTADYVAGWPNGAYSVESYVTGYIMDEADDYQRTFSLVGSNINLQFDLRRSNWIEVVMHMPAGVLLSAWNHTAVTLVAEDAAGMERGVAAVVANRADSADGFLRGSDFAAYDGGIIIEGWALTYPNMDNRGRMAQDPLMKDYGLNPTPSSHTRGAVSLAGNPYTIKLYMSDMGAPWATWWQGNTPWTSNRYAGTGWYNIVGGDPQVSVFLCNTPVSLSFDIVNAWLWISLRSTDFEVPAHSRPWTFPGSELWVDFTNTETGESTAYLDPTLYGLVQDPGVPNAYAFGWEIPGNEPSIFGLQRDDSRGLTPFDIDNFNLAGQHEHLGVYFVGNDYTFAYNGPNVAHLPDACTPSAEVGSASWVNNIGQNVCGIPWVASSWAYTLPVYWTYLPAYRSTRLPAGEYTFNAYTHGYVMRREFSVQVPFAGWADIEADLIQGGQIRTTMEFRHEGRAVDFNGFVRVEVFNEAEELVGASIYGQAEPNMYTRQGSGAGQYLNFAGFASHLWGNLGIFNNAWQLANLTGPAQAAGLGYNYTLAAGMPNPFPSNSRAQRAFTSHWFYGTPVETWRGWSGLSNVYAPLVGWPRTVSVPGATKVVYDQNYSPSDSNRLVLPAGSIESFDVYGFYWYHGGPARTWAGGWPTVNTWDGGMWAGRPDYGLRGSVDIPGWEGSGGGLYSVKVWAFDPLGADGAWDAVIPFEDWNMYAMGWPLTGIQVPWGGAVEVFVTMNNLAQLRGTIRWFDMYGNLRPLPWAQISASPGPSTDNIPAYSGGLGPVGAVMPDSAGSYLMWLPAGAHDVSVSTSEAPEIWGGFAQSNSDFTVVVTDGWMGGGDTQLSGSGTPIPEVPAFVAPLAIFAALAASVWLLRKRTTSIPLLMK